MAEKFGKKCLQCEEEVMVGQWTCADGASNHRVEPKTYRVCDAPQDPGKPAEGSQAPIVRGRTMVCGIPPAKKVMEGGEVRMVGEGSVEFINGQFTTADPETQYWLNKKPAYNRTEEEWKVNWLSKDEQLAEKELTLNRLRERIEHEQNALLAATKQKIGKSQATA